MVKKCWHTQEVQKVFKSKKRKAGFMVSDPKESEGEGEERESLTKGTPHIQRNGNTNDCESIIRHSQKQSYSGPILLKQLKEKNILSKVFIAREK